MNTIFVLIIMAAVLAVLAWNFVPPIREKLRGWTTMAEAALAATLPFIGNTIDAFGETDWKAFMPHDAWPYVIGGLAGWFIFKRAVTNTAAGSSK